MTTLTPKQRVKVNAALAIIHDHGFSADAVTQAARSYMAQGYDARRSYEIALNDFASSKPEIAPNLVQATRLVEASDDATVAQYDTALSRYIESGDTSGIDALAPMIAQDSIALAVRNGEVAPEDATSVDALETAMGFAPSDGMAEAFAAAPVAAAAPAASVQQPSAAPPAQSSSFAFAPQRAATPSAPTYVNDRQASAAGPSGVRAPMSADRQKAWAGVPTGAAGVRTASGGYRAPMTGERLARWTGTPLAVSAPEAAA